MKIIYFCVFTFVVVSSELESAFASDDFIEGYLNNISISTTVVFCIDHELLEYTRLTKKECIDLITDYSVSCNSVIKPLIPNLDAVDTVSDYLKMKLTSLATLYGMCINSHIFDDTRLKKKSKK